MRQPVVANDAKLTATCAPVPLKWVGPLCIHDGESLFEIDVPLATYETPLWASVARGACVVKHAGGMTCTLLKESMSRSILLEAASAKDAAQIARRIETDETKIAEVIARSSCFARLQSFHIQQTARLLFIRLSIETGDASGHNMVTKAAQKAQEWLIKRYGPLSYVSLSGNFCCDKKASSVNAILGRGKSVCAEVTLSRELCQRYLRSTPEKIVDLNIKKNLVGSSLAGSLHSANAHFANMLLGIYMATGQDAANIVEGSQGMTYAELVDDQLYFSVTLPHIIVGTVGNGKHLDFVKENLARLGCQNEQSSGEDARRLAKIIAGTVLCGELSLLAALTQEGELMRSHELLERRSATT